MEVKTGKLNQWLILAVVVLFLAAAVVAAVLAAPGKELAAGAGKDYVEVEGAFCTVRFGVHSTTAEGYDTLRAACEDGLNAAVEAGTAASSDTVLVSEDTFVDTGAADGAVLPETPLYVESDTIYFEDLVLIRYVGQSGEHLTLAGGYDQSGTPAVLSMEELSPEGFGLSYQMSEKKAAGSGTVDEAAFLACVEGCAAALLSGDTEFDALSHHFTENGAAALFRVGRSFGADENSQAEVLLCGVGSTSSDEMLADRIVIRCQVTAGGEAVLLDLLLKLNSDLLIFDVDLI